MTLTSLVADLPRRVTALDSLSQKEVVARAVPGVAERTLPGTSRDLPVATTAWRGIKMKAAVTLGPEHMELRSVPAVEPGPGQALLSVCVVGLCGSDVHLYRGTHPYSRFPTVQGHELSGVVKGLAHGYDGALNIGDLVAVEPFIPCGTCIACRRGHPNCCSNLAVLGAHVDGALVEEITMNANSCHPVGQLDVETAALVEPVSIGLQAVARSGAREGDTVVVIGAGPIGQTIVLAAHDRGASVMAADILDNRLALALDMGADVTVNTSVDDLATEG